MRRRSASWAGLPGAGVEDDPLVALRVVEGVAVQIEPSHERVVDALAGGAARLNVLLVPQSAELGALREQPLDEGAHARVPWVASRRGTQVGHRLAGEGVRAFRVEPCAGFRVGEEPHGDVPLVPRLEEPAQQEARHRVPRQHVQDGVADQRGRVVEAVEHPQDARPHLPHRSGRRLRRRTGQAVQVVALVVRQPQRPADRAEDLAGRPGTARLLQPDVVLHRHPGKLRDLLPPQPGRAPPRPRLKPHIGGTHPGPALPQEGGQFPPVHLVHPSRLPRRPAPTGVFLNENGGTYPW
ncbi:hypothetical protein Acsp03_05320 [Actinomadura sp. NBRC 104412]|nr:hypothetical protein Acsp03_05320 [Actinomadura sp. NBRC 104412]